MSCLITIIALAIAALASGEYGFIFGRHAPTAAVLPRQNPLVGGFPFPVTQSSILAIPCVYYCVFYVPANAQSHQLYVLNCPENVKIGQSSVPLRATELADVVSSTLGFTVSNGVSSHIYNSQSHNIWFTEMICTCHHTL